MAIEACKIGSDRSETLLNLNEFSLLLNKHNQRSYSDYQRQKILLCQKISAAAFGSLISLMYNYCHLHSKSSVEDHHGWPFFRLLKGESDCNVHMSKTHINVFSYTNLWKHIKDEKRISQCLKFTLNDSFYNSVNLRD